MKPTTVEPGNPEGNNQFGEHFMKISAFESGGLEKLWKDKLLWREPVGDYRGHWTAQDKWELQGCSSQRILPRAKYYPTITI